MSEVGADGLGDDGLVLRPCTADDAAGLAAMYTLDRAELGDETPAFFEESDQRARITRRWVEFNTLGFVAVVGGEIAGLFLLEDVTPDFAIVGYFVASRFRGRGIATRALGRLVDIAFEVLGIPEIVADILPDNATSLGVAGRNGFQDVGTVMVDGEEQRRLVLVREFPD